jgi:hypothetical protein
MKLTQRIYQEYLVEDEKSNHKETIKWLETYATFTHKTSDEFLLFVPPFNEFDAFIDKFYPKMPEELRVPLLQASKNRQGEGDDGYLMIAFI